MLARTLRSLTPLLCIVSGCIAEGASHETHRASCEESEPSTDDPPLMQWIRLPYQTFGLETGTPLPEAKSDYVFLLAGNRDLFAIRKRGAGTGSTEVHVLSAESNYQRFLLQTGTALHESGSNFDFVLSESRNLIAIKKNQTDSGKTEVHVLSAASGYRSFVMQTATALEQAPDDTFEFEIGRGDNLFAIKKRGTESKRVEVHILSAASNYQSLSLHTATDLDEVLAPSYAFVVDRSSNDLFTVSFRSQRPSGSGYMMLREFSAAAGYKAGASAGHQTPLLPSTAFDFALATNRDLFAIKKSATGTSSTEVHIVPR